MNDVTRETITLNEIDNEASFSVTDYIGLVGSVVGWFGDALGTVSPLVPRLQQFTQNDGDGVAIAVGIEADIGLRNRIRFINRLLDTIPGGVSRDLSRKIKRLVATIAPNLSAGGAVGYDLKRDFLQTVVKGTVSSPDWLSDSFSDYQPSLYRDQGC